MTPEKAISIKTFAQTWISKVVSKKKDYCRRLNNIIDDLIPSNIEEYDPWGILDIDDWDRGIYYGMGYRLRELFYEGYFISKKAQNDIECAIRIGIDLYINQSGGVVGYTVGDLRKVFDGNIPEEISKSFECNITMAKDSDSIWL